MASKELVNYCIKYIIDVIISFESGLYKMLLHTNSDRLKLLTSNQQHFLTIYRDLHEDYYTKTYNSIVEKNDKYITDTFNKFKELSNHPTRCTLNMLANLIVSVHFNLNRKNLKSNDLNEYIKSLKIEIMGTIPDGTIEKLFDHQCYDNEKIQPLGVEEKFIKIDLFTENCGNKKEIKSFINQENDDE